MNQDYNIAIVSVIKMIVENNAGCVARKLKEVGYETKSFIPAPELEVALFQLHNADAATFYKVMNNCEWNYGNTNWTNDNKYKEQIMSAVQTHTGKKVDKHNWWDTMINYLKQQSEN